MRHDRSGTPPSGGRALPAVFDVARLAYGIWLVVAPRQGAALARGRPVPDTEATVARVLGWRPRRVSGFNLDRLTADAGFDVAQALVGTEGTCVTLLSATVKLIPALPERELPGLFPDDTDAKRLAEQTFELTEYLVRTPPELNDAELGAGSIRHDGAIRM